MNRESIARAARVSLRSDITRRIKRLSVLTETRLCEAVDDDAVIVEV